MIFPIVDTQGQVLEDGLLSRGGYLELLVTQQAIITAGLKLIRDN